MPPAASVMKTALRPTFMRARLALPPMKVALVFNAIGGKAGGGGGARQMLELAGALVRQGHEVVVACHDHEPGGDFEPPPGIEILSVREAPVGPIVGPRNQIERVWRGMAALA